MSSASRRLARSSYNDKERLMAEEENNIDLPGLVCRVRDGGRETCGRGTV